MLLGWDGSLRQANCLTLNLKSQEGCSNQDSIQRKKGLPQTRQKGEKIAGRFETKGHQSMVHRRSLVSLGTYTAGLGAGTANQMLYEILALLQIACFTFKSILVLFHRFQRWDCFCVFFWLSGILFSTLLNVTGDAACVLFEWKCSLLMAVYKTPLTKITSLGYSCHCYTERGGVCVLILLR